MDLFIATDSVPDGSDDAIPTTGTPQFLTNGSPVPPVRIASIPPAYWFNQLARNIVAIIKGCGLTPDRTVATQLWTALSGYFAPLKSPALTGNPTAPTPAVGDNDTSIATTAFVQAAFKVASYINQTSASGQLVVPAGPTMVNAELRGAGPGGGAGGTNTSSAVSAGGGGGSGAWLKVAVPVKAGDVLSWTIGAAGAAGQENGASGTAGGDTVLFKNGGEIARAGGGKGGINATAGNVGAGGAGGVPTIASGYYYEARLGFGGGYGEYIGNVQGFGGSGAGSLGFPSVQATGTSSNGIDGAGPGCAGSGGTGSGNGGAGKPGEIIVAY